MQNKEFVEQYSKFYFMDSSTGEFSGLRKSCCWVEEIIMGIKKKEHWEPIDVFNIIAWKTGKICQRKCSQVAERDKYILTRGLYAKGCDPDKLELKVYSNTISLGKFADNLIVKSEEKGLIKRLRNGDSESAIEAMDILDKGAAEVSGLYTIYLIAILFFLSDGYYPIFDKYALRGLVRYAKETKKISTLLTEMPLPRKSNCSDYKDLLEGTNSIYKQYIDLLDKVFDDMDWRNNRNVDRALWVFGHKQRRTF